MSNDPTTTPILTPERRAEIGRRLEHHGYVQTCVEFRRWDACGGEPDVCCEVIGGRERASAAAQAIAFAEGDIRDLLAAYDAQARRADIAEATLDEMEVHRHKNRRATQIIIDAIGSVGPESVDAAATRIVAELAALHQRAEKAERKHDNVADARDYWIKQAQSAQDEARHCERRAEDMRLVAYGLACGIIRRGPDQPTGDALMDRTWWLATGCPGGYIGMGSQLVPEINEFTEARSVLEQSAKEQLL